MRGFLRVVLGTVAIVAAVGAALRATGVWQWIHAQITVQFEGPTGVLGGRSSPSDGGSSATISSAGNL